MSNSPEKLRHQFDLNPRSPPPPPPPPPPPSRINKRTCLNVIPKDLGLGNINPPTGLNKNVIVPEEVNTYLRQQLCEAIQENNGLRCDLANKDVNLREHELKIQDLTQKIKEYEGLCQDNNPYVSPGQLAQTKLVELSKKLRDRNAEIEVHKSRCTKFDKQVSELKIQIEELNRKAQPNAEPVELEPNEIKRLQDKLSHTMNKLLETKDQNSRLKHELKLANKWLQQEVGENFENMLSLQQNSTNNNNNNNNNSVNGNSMGSWRGRAQIICDLQQKNSELRDKLKEYQTKVEASKTLKTESLKKIDNLTRENLEMKQSLEDLERKFEATKARCKVLESQCAVLKTKLMNNEEDSKRDQQLIASLTSQLKAGGGAGDRLSEELKLKEDMIKNLKKEKEAIGVQLAKEKCALENKCKELDLKDEEIEVLTKRLRTSRPPSSYGQRRENPDTLAIGRLEAERIKLLELTEVNNKRLEEERDAHFKTQAQLRFEKQRGAKLEANLARLELEQNGCKNSYRNRDANTARLSDQQNLKDQLELAEETIKALTTRLEIEAFERKKDLQEISAILKNYENSK